MKFDDLVNHILDEGITDVMSKLGYPAGPRGSKLQAEDEAEQAAAEQQQAVEQGREEGRQETIAVRSSAMDRVETLLKIFAKGLGGMSPELKAREIETKRKQLMTDEGL